VPKPAAYTLAVLSLAALQIARMNAQTAPSAIPPDADLPHIIASLDTALFDAYNRCDLDKFGSYIADDVEFYHDQSGLSVGKKDLIDGVRKNICGKVRRDLVPGTLEVYPMHNFGALEIGVHRFHHPGSEDKEQVGEGKFIHLWAYKDGAWKVSRVISYDHRALPK
jgi:hypothetical protein